MSTMTARLRFTFLAAAIPVLSGGAQASAQEAFEVVPTVEIPAGYDSWSLFLVCNPAWIAANGDEGIQGLFETYRLFGDAIGPENLAIWFWKEAALVPTAELTDLSRSSEYCGRYELLPSKSPFVLVTTDYPDAAEVGEYFVVSLNGLTAEESAEVLATLTDQLLVTGLDQEELDAATRWQNIFGAAVSFVSSVGSYFNKVSFSFNTAFIKAEFSHSAP
jgi:hypothetical protein